jgi:hypothetical protein
MAKSTSVATKDNTSVALNDEDFFGVDTGLDDVDGADVTLPSFRILQGLSPQINQRKDEYIEGAQMGMIFNTATGRVTDELNVVVAAYERRNIEWIPRDKPCPISSLPQVTGGGLYQDYGTDDSVLDECVRYEENGSLWTPRGHELVVTGTWYVIDVDTLSTAFIPMGKTQFTSSKKWMAGIRDEKIRTSKGIRPAPLFYRQWTLNTKMREKGENEWFVWNHKPGPKLGELEYGRDIFSLVQEIAQTVKAGSIAIDVAAAEGDGEVRNGADAAM